MKTWGTVLRALAYSYIFDPKRRFAEDSQKPGVSCAGGEVYGAKDWKKRSGISSITRHFLTALAADY
jgi:hypothetical protein